MASRADKKKRNRIIQLNEMMDKAVVDGRETTLTFRPGHALRPGDPILYGRNGWPKAVVVSFTGTTATIRSLVWYESLFMWALTGLMIGWGRVSNAWHSLYAFCTVPKAAR